MADYTPIERDWLTKEAAHQLAARIAAYWKGRGPRPVLCHVEAAVRPVCDSGQKKKPLYFVRSNLVNGLPPQE